jgi:hypothetical protein
MEYDYWCVKTGEICDGDDAFEFPDQIEEKAFDGQHDAAIAYARAQAERGLKAVVEHNHRFYQIYE